MAGARGSTEKDSHQKQLGFAWKRKATGAKGNEWRAETRPVWEDRERRGKALHTVEWDTPVPKERGRGTEDPLLVVMSQIPFHRERKFPCIEKCK